MKKCILAVVAILVLGVPANAQILGKLKDKANQAINKEIKNQTHKISPKSGIGSVDSYASRVSKNALANISFVKNKSETTGSKVFGVNDNIYAKIKLNATLQEFLEDKNLLISGKATVPVTLTWTDRGSNVQHGEFMMAILPQSDFGKKEIFLDILPGNDATTQYSLGGNLMPIAKVLTEVGNNSSQLQPFGVQTYEFTFGPNDEYKGSFSTSIKSGADLAVMAKRAEGTRGQIKSFAAQSATLPSEFSRSGKFSDPQLSAASLKRMIEYPGMTILKLVVENIGGSDYNINKNELDVPVLKMTNKPVWVAYKEDGKCFYTKKYFTRQYEGGGKYGPLELATSTAGEVEIDCAKVK